MSRPEHLTPSLLRMDGRRPYEFRSLEIHFAPPQTNLDLTPSALAQAPQGGTGSESAAPDGRVRLVQGLNDVTCSVFGPRDSQLSGGRGGGSGSAGSIGSGPALGVEGASLDVEVVAESWSAVGVERRAAGRGDRRNVELSTLLQRALAPVVALHLYPRTSCIHLSLLISSSDGSLLPTLINASTLALLNAGIGLSDFLLSTSIAFHPRSPPNATADSAGLGTFLLDPTLAESNDLPSLTLAVTPRDGKVLLSLLDAGRGKVEGNKIEEALKIGVEALRTEFRREVEGATRDWGKKLLAASSA